MALSPARLYRLFPARLVSDLGSWEAAVQPFTHIVGYSFLGHFFLHNAQSGDFAVFYPFRQAYKSYGPFDSTSAWEEAVLQEPGFSEYVLRPDHQAAIALQVGELEADQIYIPTPYPFLGGSQAPDAYAKGDFWVFADLVGSAHGLE